MDNQELQEVAQDTFPLDDAAIQILAEIDQQAASLDASRQGVLTLFARQHKLQGQWRLAPNRRELVKAP